MQKLAENGVPVDRAVSSVPLVDDAFLDEKQIFGDGEQAGREQIEVLVCLGDVFSFFLRCCRKEAEKQGTGCLECGWGRLSRQPGRHLTWYERQRQQLPADEAAQVGCGVVVVPSWKERPGNPTTTAIQWDGEKKKHQ